MLINYNDANGLWNKIFINTVNDLGEIRMASVKTCYQKLIINHD